MQRNKETRDKKRLTVQGKHEQIEELGQRSRLQIHKIRISVAAHEHLRVVRRKCGEDWVRRVKERLKELQLVVLQVLEQLWPIPLRRICKILNITKI